MKFAASLHRRFVVEGVPYAYVTGSAAVLRLDDVSTSLLDEFSVEGGLDPGGWDRDNAGTEELSDRKATLDQMVAMGLIRPVGENAPPAAKLPPCPFPWRRWS